MGRGVKIRSSTRDTVVLVRLPEFSTKREESKRMAYKITDDCQMCAACADVCPTEAIFEGKGKYEIDPEKCEDCAACVDVCPTECIVPAE
jgi:ferredoxin